MGRYWWGGLGVGIAHIICRMNVSAAERTARIVHALFSPGGPLFGLVPQSYYLLLVGFGRACAPVRCAHPSF